MSDYAKGPVIALGPEDGESFWQPQPSTGYVINKINEEYTNILPSTNFNWKNFFIHTNIKIWMRIYHLAVGVLCFRLSHNTNCGVEVSEKTSRGILEENFAPHKSKLQKARC